MNKSKVEVMLNDEVIDSVLIAKRWYGNKANGQKVDCMPREYDYKWEMIRLMPDPSLSDEEIAALKLRRLNPAYRWVTTHVVDPFVIEGINKSIKKSNEEK